jgi:CHAT domain-containing protein
VVLRAGGEDKTDPEIRLAPLGPAAPIDRAVHAWRDAARQGIIDDKSDREIRERIWGPLAKALPQKTTRLFVAPDGELSLLPLEAIRLEDGKYLVEEVAVSYLTTGRDLMPRPQPKDKSDAALVLADPDYDADAAGKAVAAAPLGEDLTRSFKKLRRLPGFAREADAAERLLKDKGGWKVEGRRGQEASEEALRSAARPRLLYCVTHGFFLEDAKRPTSEKLTRELELAGDDPRRRLPDPGPDPRLRSGLALAGANKWQERAKKGLSDGLLTALEAEGLDLWGTELVVLSACDTGRGEVQVGEGVLGLRRAFQLAGAQCVLASLWPVPDAETEQLMTDCLKRWRDGAPPAEALRQAQLAMIRKLRESKDPERKPAPPLLWAGFVCHGLTK